MGYRPAKGMYVCGDYVYVSGANKGLNIVQYARRQYADILIHDPQTTSFTIPNGLPEGTYDVVVTNPDGQKGSLSDGFEVLQYHNPEIIKVNDVDVVWEEPVNLSFAAWETITLAPQVTDIDPDDTVTLTYYGWMTTNEKITNYSDIGKHSVTITAADNHGLSNSVIVIIEVLGIPIITSVDPDEGYNHEETVISISGVSFDEGAKVSLEIKPKLTGSIEYFYPKDIFVDRDYAYATDDTNLKIIDIKDKRNPLEIGSCDTPGTVKGVNVAGDYAYVVAYNLAPTSVGNAHSDWPPYIRPVYLNRERLVIVDISDKTRLQIVDSYIPDTPDDSDGAYLDVFQVVGDYAYVYEELKSRDSQPPFIIPDFGYPPIKIRYNGLRIIDLSDRGHPDVIGDFIPPSRPEDIYVEHIQGDQ